STEEIRVNLDRLIWRFVEGYVAEHELWQQILADQHFDGVKEAIHQASERPEGLVVGVELWARICYDYLLAFNTQVIDHDQLVSSMIPLYFARTATFVREAADDTPEQAEERIASFAEGFPAAQPYLIARWGAHGPPAPSAPSAPPARAAARAPTPASSWPSSLPSTAAAVAAAAGRRRAPPTAPPPPPPPPAARDARPPPA